MGVFDEDAAGGFDALDAPAGVAEEDDVAGAGVDGEVLVEGGDLYPFRLQYDVVEGDVGDGSAVGDGDAAGAAARMEVALDGVVEEIGAVAAAAGFDAVGEEGDELVEALAGEIAIGVGAAEDVEEGFGSQGSAPQQATICCMRTSMGSSGICKLIEFAGAHLADEGGLFHEVVAGGGEEAAFGDGSAPVAGAADALHGDGDGAGGGDLADEVDVADVDAEFE